MYKCVPPSPLHSPSPSPPPPSTRDLMETVSYQNESKSASVRSKYPTPMSGGRPTSLTAEGGVEDGRYRSPSPSDKEEQLATALVCTCICTSCPLNDVCLSSVCVIYVHTHSFERHWLFISLPLSLPLSFQHSPYPLTATIIASQSEEDLVGVERSESASSGSGEESSKPRPKRILHICASESPQVPAKDARQVQDQRTGEETARGSENRQSRQSSVQSNGEVCWLRRDGWLGRWWRSMLWFCGVVYDGIALVHSPPVLPDFSDLCLILLPPSPSG